MKFDIPGVLPGLNEIIAAAKSHFGEYAQMKETFTDIGDVAIDPCAGSGVTLLAAETLGRKSYGFEIKKEYIDAFNSKLAKNVQRTLFNIEQEQAIKRKLEKYQSNRLTGVKQWQE